MEVVPTAAVPHIAPGEFWAAHLARPDARPLLIESCPTLGAAPALRWTLESLRDSIGARSVDVRCMSAGAGEYREGRRYTLVQLPFDTYCTRILEREPEAQRHYLATSNVARVFPELVDELPSLPLVAKKHCGPFLWIAAPGHYEFAHFDPDDNLLVPVIGRKRVRMWAPEDFHRLYPNPLGSSGRTVQFQAASDEPDPERHPLARGLKCWEALVCPGQQLFIPGFTIHQVTSLDACVSVNVFCGDQGSSDYLAKLCRPPRLGAFSYWLLNIVEQNRPFEGWSRTLPYLPRSLSAFLANQLKETATESQLVK